LLSGRTSSPNPRSPREISEPRSVGARSMPWAGFGYEATRGAAMAAFVK